MELLPVSMLDSIVTRPLEIIRVTYWSTVASTVKIETRFNVSGEVKIGGEWLLPSAGNGVAVTRDIPLTSGSLLSCNIQILDGIVKRGQAYVKAELLFGLATTSQISKQVLCKGYITTNTGINYPRSEPLESVDGYGHQNSIAGNSVGAATVLTIGANRTFRPDITRVVYVAAAAVANRNITLMYQRAGVTLLYNVARINHVAGFTGFYQFGDFANDATYFGALFNVLNPRIRLIAGDTITINAINIQAADTIDVISYGEEHIDV